MSTPAADAALLYAAGDVADIHTVMLHALKQLDDFARLGSPHVPGLNDAERGTIADHFTSNIHTHSHVYNYKLRDLVREAIGRFTTDEIVIQLAADAVLAAVNNEILMVVKR